MSFSQRERSDFDFMMRSRADRLVRIMLDSKYIQYRVLKGNGEILSETSPMTVTVTGVDRGR
jgi:hypothetical protein